MEERADIKRLLAADRIERLSWLSLGGAVLMVVLAATDLASGGPAGERIDYVLLAAAGGSIWGTFSQRRVARRMRSNTPPAKARIRTYVGAAASITVSLLFSAGVGYALDGLRGAILFPTVVVLVSGGATLVGVRRRRRGV